MSDVTLTPCENERILHDGQVYSHGENFKLADDAADTLIREGKAEKTTGKETDKGPKADEDAAAATAKAEAAAGDGGGKVPPSKDVIKAVPDMDDQALAQALEIEEAQKPQRKSVLKAIKAEQKKRADAAASS